MYMPCTFLKVPPVTQLGPNDRSRCDLTSPKLHVNFTLMGAGKNVALSVELQAATGCLITELTSCTTYNV